MPAIIHNYQVCTRTVFPDETQILFCQGEEPDEVRFRNVFGELNELGTLDGRQPIDRHGE